MTATTLPNIEDLRREALLAGALDPATLRFRIVEYDKSSGELLGVPGADMGFCEAVEATVELIESRSGSYFCLQPVGFLQ